MRSGSRFLCALAFVGLATGLCLGRADDADAVRDKLFKAKKEYDAEAEKFRQVVAESLDKREDDARKSGNKKLVDQVKADRAAFEDKGELPAALPPGAQIQMRAAGAKLERAYGAAAKEFLRLKEDAAAEAAEKEQQRFFVDYLGAFGKRTFLVTLKHYDVKVGGGEDWFSTTGKFNKLVIKKDGKPTPHSVFMHPPEKGTAQVKYPLAGRYLVFRATVGIPLLDSEGEPGALTFEVLGDGKSLWKSEPVTKFDSFQTCAVRVEKVKVLTLLVHAPDSNRSGRAVWFEPVLIE